MAIGLGKAPAHLVALHLQARAVGLRPADPLQRGFMVAHAGVNGRQPTLGGTQVRLVAGRPQLADGLLQAMHAAVGPAPADVVIGQRQKRVGLVSHADGFLPGLGNADGRGRARGCMVAQPGLDRQPHLHGRRVGHRQKRRQRACRGVAVRHREVCVVDRVVGRFAGGLLGARVLCQRQVDAGQVDAREESACLAVGHAVVQQCRLFEAAERGLVVLDHLEDDRLVVQQRGALAHVVIGFCQRQRAHGVFQRAHQVTGFDAGDEAVVQRPALAVRVGAAFEHGAGVECRVVGECVIEQAVGVVRLQQQRLAQHVIGGVVAAREDDGLLGQPQAARKVAAGCRGRGDEIDRRVDGGRVEAG